ncbi:ATP-binding cassette domain-containing protein [Bifidobacterium breve]|nr:ATP-binding cassette domain-containing protein [Bifidobacterium breve]
MTAKRRDGGDRNLQRIVARNAAVAQLGASGAGKSTVLNILGGTMETRVERVRHHLCRPLAGRQEQLTMKNCQLHT